MAQQAKEEGLSLPTIAHWLSQRDRKLSVVIESVGELPIGEKRNNFESLARAIVGQQLSAKAAQTIFARLIAACEGGELSARGYLEVEKPLLRKVGLSARKESFLHGLASAIDKGILVLESLEEQDDAAAIERLCAIKGIGRWTAEMHLMFGMNRPNVFPIDDAALRNVMCRVYGWREEEFEARSLPVSYKWIPYRSIACRYFYAFGDL